MGQSPVFNILVLPSRKLLSYIEKEIWVTEFSLKKKSVSMA
jgi:hypothetical protein